MASLCGHEVLPLVQRPWGFFEGVEAAAEKAVELARERGVPLVRTTNVTNL
jgi:hypothetical protein